MLYGNIPRDQFLEKAKITPFPRYPRRGGIRSRFRVIIGPPGGSCLRERAPEGLSGCLGKTADRMGLDPRPEDREGTVVQGDSGIGEPKRLLSGVDPLQGEGEIK